MQPTSSSTESKTLLYRSVSNSEFRNSVSYGVENRFDMDGSTAKTQTSEDGTNATKLSKEKSTSGDDIHETKEGSKVEQTSYVGFANLPNQVYWKAAHKGFEFTLMLVGASGLGKSTLMNSLFLTDIYNSVTYPGPTIRSKKTVSVETTTVKLKEGGVNLTLTLVDTPGFGDAINNSLSWIPITEYVEKKYEDFFVAESKVNRKPILDQRIHCCLYFIQPTGHGLKQLDIECMKRLSDKVNIIPVIAKADTLTPEECFTFKKQILQDVEANNIKIYKFPDLSEEDEGFELNKSLKEKVPFAVAGSNTTIEVNGKTVRGRKYSWGVIDIENLEHCDFIALRKMMISTHLQDLKDTTNNTLYENYRYRKLSNLKYNGTDVIKNPLLEFEEEKQGHVLKLKKMETEMDELLEKKVREKEKELRDTEKLLNMRYEVTKKALEEEVKELEEKRKTFELEKDLWEKEKVMGSKESIESKRKKRGLF
ncbi:septin-7-like [Anoplophora glabripennis]|uniref:septin-7-like n=1 Tax=Anoplophora glabripennis TaxID=217634 RepID=UPI000873E530|nr:septin-7-like [Anoplophora glabripennis]